VGQYHEASHRESHPTTNRNTAAMFFLDLHKCFVFKDLLNHFKCHILFLCGKYKERFLRNSNNQNTKSPASPDIRTLNCRVELTKQKQGDSTFDAFIVSICGSIHSPVDSQDTSVVLKVSIMDMTRGLRRAEPVLCQESQGQGRIKRWQMGNSVFCYETPLGRLPDRITILPEWIEVAGLNIDWLNFPRRGRRNMQFSVSVLSRQNRLELACAKCNFFYINPSPGYMDVNENTQLTKSLTTALAFAVSAADLRLYNCEIDIIKSWTKNNFLCRKASPDGKTQDTNHRIQDDMTRNNLEKAMNKAVAFFRAGNQLNTYAICKKVVEISSTAARQDILALCLSVAKAKGFVAAEELAVLKDFAGWLEIDMNRFRCLMEKILPANMHQVRDVEITLGLTTDMSRENTRQQLNKEYGKWNSRVTSPNSQIRAQAEQMLKLIAEARCLYIG
jgi:hypothetical protein